jgi:hypothetical protein
MIPVFPQQSSRLPPWAYGHAIYKKRKEIERRWQTMGSTAFGPRHQSAMAGIKGRN